MPNLIEKKKIEVTKTTWKELMQLKIATGSKSIDDVISKLLKRKMQI